MYLFADVVGVPMRLVWPLYTAAREMPIYVLLLVLNVLFALVILLAYVVLHVVAPKPRAPFPSEKTYVTTKADGSVSSPQPLPCWYDRWLAEATLAERARGGERYPCEGFFVSDGGTIEPAEVEVSVVVPAYNEEARIVPALEEMVDHLDKRFGRPRDQTKTTPPRTPTTPHHRLVFDRSTTPVGDETRWSTGYEILVVNDGSRDGTVDVVLEFSRRRRLHDVLRVVTLARNRGKGGGVTHGLRHVRGAYALFCDADGASRFADLDRLLEGLEDVVDGSNRGVAIGSRAHLVGSEDVVKVCCHDQTSQEEEEEEAAAAQANHENIVVVQRSAVRNFLMRSFHFVLTILTPPATSRIRDTQCGFKLFSRAALPHIVPYMHAEGWIFDIEMLMLAESAPPTPVLASDGSVIGLSPGIKVAEVPIAWHEVAGSKMNLLHDSIAMALGLAVLRASWMLGVYRRRLT